MHLKRINNEAILEIWHTEQWKDYIIYACILGHKDVVKEKASICDATKVIENYFVETYLLCSPFEASWRVQTLL